MSKLFATATLLALLGCQRTPPPREPHALDTDEVDRRVAEAPRAEPEAPPEITPARSGWIDRATLDRTLDAGIGAFLGEVEVEAQLQDGRFRGWRVVHYDNPWVDVRPGDVVLKVNGLVPETPTDLSHLWTALRTASAIQVHLLRGNDVIELSFAVASAHPPVGP